MSPLQVWLIAILAAVLIGAVGGYVGARRGGAGKVGSTLMALFAGLVAGWLVFTIADECLLSEFLLKGLHARLTPEELTTLKPDRMLCSTTYTFTRGGKRHAAIVVSGLIRDKIFIGNDESP